MDIVSTRILRGKNSTISKVFINGVASNYLLEDKDRGLRADMPLSEIKKLKVHGQTAIPEGRYEVVVDFSIRFQKMLPRLLNVPGFEGIRLHPGNWIKDTEGCPLPGLRYTKDPTGEYMVVSSKLAFNPMFDLIYSTFRRGEKVWYSVKSSYENQ